MTTHRLRATRPEGAPRERGNFLVATAILFSVVTVVVLGSLGLATERLQSVRLNENRLVAEYAAKSGVAQNIADLAAIQDMSTTGDPWSVYDALDTNQGTGPGGYTQVSSAQPLADLDGLQIAQLDTFIDVDRSDPSKRLITVKSYAYVPDKAAYESGVRDAARFDATSVAEVSFEGAEVFDYAYFINHWGWFYGSSITANGNVRSNGQFDFGGYSATVNGSPRYTGSDGHLLTGYQDDNGDGLEDGQDGGSYSGMSVIGESNVRGTGGETRNIHENVSKAAMPNLSDLTYYEEKAITDGASIGVGGDTYVSGVLGDDAGEPQHLYLVGTATDPIRLNGAVVVRGSVIIKGYVTGQGSIYSGGNVYVADDLLYLNGPSSDRPSSNDQSTVESWREDALTKDSLGLFAKEHVVIGDYTNSTWQYYVKRWINDSNNESHEDAGSDGIHNTRKGADGILGTADDDVLEDDGVWTVSRYTEADAAAGVIPSGKSVGDPIPGTGEDIDGDGVYDGTTQMSEFNLPASLDPSLWGGNMSRSYSKYRDVATVNIATIDATLYTNHTLAALMYNSGGTVAFNGSVVSRNESIIYSASRLHFNHDERLTGRGSPDSGFDAPITWEPVKTIATEYDEHLPAEVAAEPGTLGAYWTGEGIE